MIHRKPPQVFHACRNTLTSVIEPSGGASGQATDIAIHAKEILRVRLLLTTIYQRHCAKIGESEAIGLERFGTNIVARIIVQYCLSAVPYLVREGARTGLLYDRFGRHLTI